MLVSDEELVIWSPTAESVEPEQAKNHPNAIFLKGAVVDKIESAVGADHSDVLAKDSEIGKEALGAEELNKVVRTLKNNPPAPFDLAQKARVFSTKFQFIEAEVRGAEWTGRRIKLSNLLLNADLPKELQDVLETNVHPFQTAADLKFEIPYIADGEPMYRRDGSQATESVTQAEIQKKWSEVRDKYLVKLKGFGWLIKKDSLKDFRAEVKTYEESLKMWVEAFKEHVDSEEDTLVKSIVSSIEGRLERSQTSGFDKLFDLEDEINKGLRRMRVIEPVVRIVPKNVSWESSRDAEFLKVLKDSFSDDDLKGWFEEFTAAKEKV